MRIKNGKPARGTIKISISQESGRKVDIVLCDDGAGIDREKLRESALKNSVVSSQNLDQMNDQEILNLIFRSGVTTSPMITDLSGRGLGMAIVAAKVEGLGGSITIESEAGQGTSFVISLPLSLSTFRGSRKGIQPVICCTDFKQLNGSFVSIPMILCTQNPTILVAER